MDNKKIEEFEQLMDEMMLDVRCGLDLIGESVKKFDAFIDETKLSNLHFFTEDQEFLDLLHNVSSVDIDEARKSLSHIGYKIKDNLIVWKLK